jgi:catechol 2,3-dioxygenase-like lactoylglutathione lyase family enzyme
MRVRGAFTAALGLVLIGALASLQTAQPAAQSAAGAAVIAIGNFSHIVANLDRSVAFYHDGLGLEPTAPLGPFEPNVPIMRAGNVMGAQTRYTVLKVPGSTLNVELIEYKDIDRTPIRPRFQDPGTGNLIVTVRDLDRALTRLKTAGAKVISVGGNPATIAGKMRVVFLQDPDGFVIELNQSNPSPRPSAGTPGQVVTSAFEITIEDTERTAAFYRDLLGFQVTAGTSFNGDKLMTDTAGTPGARFRQSRLQVPGTAFSITAIEFRDIERKPHSARLQDPGTAMLQLMVADIDSLLKTLKAGGATVVSVGGEAVTMGALRLAVVRDPNNLFLELIQRPR